MVLSCSPGRDDVESLLAQGVGLRLHSLVITSVANPSFSPRLGHWYRDVDGPGGGYGDLGLVLPGGPVEAGEGDDGEEQQGEGEDDDVGVHGVVLPVV